MTTTGPIPKIAQVLRDYGLAGRKLSDGEAKFLADLLSNGYEWAKPHHFTSLTKDGYIRFNYKKIHKRLPDCVEARCTVKLHHEVRLLRELEKL